MCICIVMICLIFYQIGSTRFSDKGEFREMVAFAFYVIPCAILMQGFTLDYDHCSEAVKSS